MATDTERALSIIQEKVELLTGERANGDKRAVRIAELDTYVKALNDRAATLSKTIANASQATTDEYWINLKKEHDLISAEIDAAVNESSKILKQSISEAKQAIADVKLSLQAARNEAGMALVMARTEVGTARTEAQAAIAEVDAAIADANAAIAEAQADIDSNHTAALAAFSDVNTALAEARADIDSNHTAALAARAELQTAIDEANADIASNHAAVVNAQTDATAARAELQTVATTITQIENNVANNAASITVEAGARAAADTAIAGQITTIQSNVSSNSAAISNEIVARTSADTALASRIDNLTVVSGGAAAAIDQEAIARIAGDDALAADIMTLTSTVNGNTAAISSETTARTTADNAIASQISALTTTVNNNTAAITSEATTRASADSALSGRVTTIEASVTNAGTSGGLLARVISEETARASSDTALAGQITSLTSTVNNNQSTISASISSEAATRASADSALSTRIDNITATAGGATAAIDAEATARIAGDNALATQITSVSATASKQRVFYQASAPSSSGRTVGDLWYDNDDGNKHYYWDGTNWIDNSDARFTAIAASVTNETSARISADSALSAQITTLTSNYNSNLAAIQSEATTRANADTALSGQISSLTSTVNTNNTNQTAAVNNEATTRANADSALSSQISTVNATASKQRVFSQTSAPSTTGRITGDLWIDTDDSNKLYYWDGSAWSIRDDPRIPTLTAAITTEQTARADADSALATSISSVSAAANRQRVFSQSTAPSSTGRAVGDLWLDSANGYKQYYWNGSSWADNSDGRFSTISASVTSEAAARISADSALSTRIDNITATAGGATAAIDSEATARIAADDALAAQITSLTSTVNTNNTTQTASINSEATTRANADTALSGQISTVSAQASAQRVFRQSTAPATSGRIVGDIWFDTGNGNKPYYWNASSWVETTDIRITDNAAAITSEQTARANADSALSSQISTVSATASKQRVFSQISAPSTTGRIVGDLWIDTDDNNRIYFWSGTTWDLKEDPRIPTLSASITSEQVARANADSALAADITTVSAAANKQRTFNQSTAPSTSGRSEGDLWFDSANGFKPYFWKVGTGWVDNSDGRFTTIAASVSTETSARISGDNAISAQITTLTSNLNTNTAAINSEAVTRANADSALSGQITTVSATASKQRVYRQTTAPGATGLITGDLWFDSDDNNKPYYWSGTAWVDTTDARVTTLQADVATETLARANADSALSSQITTVSATANKQRVFSQTTAPATTGRTVGDLWYDSDDGFKPYYWNGSAWVDNSDNRFSTIAASVTNEATARVSGDNAISASVTALTSTVNSNKALFDTEVTTRANADSALSASLTSLTSTVNANKASFDSEVVTRANADTALSGQITSLTTTVTNNKATLDQEITTRANADSALSSSLTTLTSTVNGNTSSINTLSASYNGVAVKYGVTGTINQQTGGFVLTGIGKNDGSASYLLEITSDVIINGNLLVTGSVKNQGLEDYAASNSGLSTGIKSSGNVSIKVRKNSRVACFASYSSNTNDTAAGAFLKITANGNSISNVPLTVSGKILPLTTLTVYPGSAGTRVQGNGQSDASTYYSYSEQYVAYYYYVDINGDGIKDGPFAAYANRTISFPPSSAFDDSNSSAWFADKSPSPWLRYVYSTPTLVGVYKIMGYSSSAALSTQGRAPKAWSLQASNDGTTWTTLDTRSGQINWGDQEDRQFAIANPQTFTQFRMLITESVDSAETLVGVVQLSFYLPGNASDSENIVFNAYIDTTAVIAGYVSLYVVELSK